ncbi:MAG: sigma 54 modulation/S30EA ribosomal C-terminal domain-containing protein, partial [Pseudomonadota bacterium]
RRLKDHRPERLDGRSSVEAATYIIAAPEEESEAGREDFTPVIIAESTTALRPMSVGDAVTELDLTGAPVLVFRHAAHGGIDVVYRRADGHFGWINSQPSAAADSH